MYPQVEWLIGGEPREVQLEALRRSFYGYSLKSHKEDGGKYVPLRHDLTPATGWGHLMEMRLGKTPTILNEFELFARYYDFERLVVFSPNQYKEDWALEAEKYGSSVPMIAYEQSELSKMTAAFNKAKGRLSFAVNYEALMYDQTLDFLSAVINKRTLLVADESIKIKNPTSFFTKGALLLRKEAAISRIATGLPMTQGPTDFYSQARFIDMYDGYDFYSFRGRYCKMGGFKNKQVKGVKNEERLRADINSCSFVAKRKDWGTLAGVEFYDVKLTMAPEQKAHYAAMESDLVTLVTETNGMEHVVSADQVVGKLMKMQQISSGFVYNEDGRALEIIDMKKSPKMQYLTWLIENELVGKIVVPFHYTKSGQALLECLEKYAPAAILSEEAMRKSGRDYVSEKRRFNHDPACRVIVGNLETMKYGHDLTGNENDRCATMFFFENNYSLDSRTQVEARNTTAFQTWSNLYFDPYCSPVEKKAITALVNKQNIVEAVLGAYRDDRVRSSTTHAT